MVPKHKLLTRTPFFPNRTCFNDGRPGNERRVQVVLGRDTEIQTIVWNRVVELEARSVVRFERAN